MDDKQHHDDEKSSSRPALLQDLPDSSNMMMNELDEQALEEMEQEQPSEWMVMQQVRF
jgi:hypothetical protein